MIMTDDKKKLATLIIGSATKKSDEPVEAPTVENAEQDDSIAKETAASELLSAIEAKDPKALADAITALIELCSYDEASEAPEME